MAPKTAPPLRHEIFFNQLRMVPNYPWKAHWLILAPLLLAVFGTGFLHGFWGDRPRLWYEALRQASPAITPWVQAVTDYTGPAIYICYAALFIQALVGHDRKQAIFVLRFALGAVIFSLVLTQAIKTGLGMPRPGHIMPPKPFSFSHGYSSFPSGHTVAVITAALPLALWTGNNKAYGTASVFIAAVGFSRLWLGAHHPADILGAVIVGSMAARVIYSGAKAKTGIQMPDSYTAVYPGNRCNPNLSPPDGGL